MGGGHFLKYSISLMHMMPPPHPVLRNVTYEVDDHDGCCGFLKEQQLCWMCTSEISSAFVHTKLRGIEPTCIISDDRGWPCISSSCSSVPISLYCKQQMKTLVVAGEWGYRDFICTCLWAQYSWDRAESKSMPRSRKDVCCGLATWGNNTYTGNCG